MKHIVVLSALIMTSTLAHAGVMPEDLMLPSVEATNEVIDQAVISEPLSRKVGWVSAICDDVVIGLDIIGEEENEFS